MKNKLIELVVLAGFLVCCSTNNHFSRISQEKGYAKAKKEFAKSSGYYSLADLQNASLPPSPEPIFSVYSELGYYSGVLIFPDNNLHNSNSSRYTLQDSKKDTTENTILYIFGGERKEPIKRIEPLRYVPKLILSH